MAANRERKREMEKVGGLILAGETFSPHPVFVLALLKHLQGGQERKGRRGTEGGAWAQGRGDTR